MVGMRDDASEPAVGVPSEEPLSLVASLWPGRAARPGRTASRDGRVVAGGPGDDQGGAPIALPRTWREDRPVRPSRAAELLGCPGRAEHGVGTDGAAADSVHVHAMVLLLGILTVILNSETRSAHWAARFPVDAENRY